MSRINLERSANLVVTTSNGHSQRCLNPFCSAVIEPLNHGQWRRTRRRYCNDECKSDHYALRRVKALLDQVGVVTFHDLMDKA